MQIFANEQVLLKHKSKVRQFNENYSKHMFRILFPVLALNAVLIHQPKMNLLSISF